MTLNLLLNMFLIFQINKTRMSQKIRIKLKSYDHNLVDKSAEKIVKTVKASGAVVSGPIPLPTHNVFSLITGFDFCQ